MVGGSASLRSAIGVSRSLGLDAMFGSDDVDHFTLSRANWVGSDKMRRSSGFVVRLAARHSCAYAWVSFFACDMDGEYRVEWLWPKRTSKTTKFV